MHDDGEPIEGASTLDGWLDAPLVVTRDRRFITRDKWGGWWLDPEPGETRFGDYREECGPSLLYVERGAEVGNGFNYWWDLWRLTSGDAVLDFILQTHGKMMDTEGLLFAIRDVLGGQATYCPGGQHVERDREWINEQVRAFVAACR